MKNVELTEDAKRIFDEEKLAAVAVGVAHEGWENSHGFGLYHVAADAYAGEVARARQKVNQWANKLAGSVSRSPF